MIFRSRLALVAGIGLAMLVACATPQTRQARFLERGKRLLASRDYERAVLEFRNALQVNPRSAEPYFEIGLVRLQQGRHADALSQFQQAVALNSKHAAARMKSAELMAFSEHMKSVEEARQQLTVLSQENPTDSGVLDALAVVEARMGQVDDAMAHLDRSLAQSPGRVASAIALARLKAGRKDIAGAEKVLLDSTVKNPRSANAHLALAQFYLSQNRLSEAEARTRTALEIEPENGPALVALAVLELRANNKGAAERTYARLSALDGKEYKPLHAIYLFREGHFDAALTEFETLANRDREDRAARSRLIAAYLALGKVAEAEKRVSAALEMHPKDSDALFQRAQISLRARRYASAESDLHQVLTQSPDSAHVHFALARVYAATGAHGRQRAELQEALNRNSNFLAARLALADALLAANAGKTALEIIEAAPRAQRGLAPAVASRNWALLATGDRARARQGVDQGLATARAPEFLLQDAILKNLAKDQAGARTSLEEALTTNPGDVRCLRLLTETLHAMNRGAEAEKHLRAAAESHRQSAPVQHLLGEWLLARARYPEARAAFAAGAAADSAYIDAQLGMADTDLRAGNLAGARQTLEAILNAHGEDNRARFLLAGLELRTGNQSGAVAQYRAILAVDSSNVAALNNLAYYSAADNPDTAIKYAQQAAELAPFDASVQDTLGWIYYRKGVFPSAVRHLQTAVGKEATPLRKYHLGMAYLKVGEHRLAQDLISAALREEPGLRTTKD